MSGHSKWSQIKRQKGSNDAKRGQLFTRLGREIAVAAREGGGDVNANVRLRLAVQHARESNMPLENVERAIKRGTGGGESGSLDEILYEGYGPGGAALLVEVMTDNRNRTVGELRSVLNKYGGTLGESGSVAWQFEDRGVITVALHNGNPENLELAAIDAGAVDVSPDDDRLEVLTEPHDLEGVRHALESEKAEVVNAERSRIASTSIPLDSKQAAQMLRLIDKLEELDDVQKVYSNADISDEDIEAYEA